MRSIFIKEINSFFSSIVGYVAILVFLIANGLLLWILPDSSILNYGYANLDRYFDMSPWLLMMLIPAITMRSFADEFKGGTIEWLSTKPLTDLDIILGKYFASVTLILFAIIPTFTYVYTIDTLATNAGSIDMGGIIGSYVGLMLLASGFAAIGIFCSALTSNQIVGFLIGLFACFILYSGFSSISKIDAFAGSADYYLNLIGMSFHYNSISRGVIDSRDVIFFLSFIILFLALTRIVINSRTWDTATQS